MLEGEKKLIDLYSITGGNIILYNNCQNLGFGNKLLLLKDPLKMSKTNFWNSDSPLTSKRGRLILSNPDEAEILISHIRESRSIESKGIKKIKTIKTIEFSDDFKKELIDSFHNEPVSA